MTYLALHLAHYKKADISRINAHDQRMQQNPADHINASKSSLNYQASTGQPLQKISYAQALDGYLLTQGIHKERKGHSLRYVYADGKPARRDANIITSVVITLDNETAEKWGGRMTRDYFKACSEYLRGLFGNRIDDSVHADEDGAGVHMHYVGVSLKQDSNGVYKFNTKKTWTRQSLRDLHTNMTAYLRKNGFPVTRGEEYSDIDYKEDYKDAKRERQRKAAQANKIISNLTALVNRANAHTQHQEAKQGFLGMGQKEDVIITPTADVKNIEKLLNYARQALEALKDTREHKNYYKKYLESQEKIKELQRMLDVADGNHKQELGELKDQRQKELAAERKAGYNACLQDYKNDITNGRTIRPLLSNKEAVDVINQLLDRERKRNRPKTKTNDNYKGR